MEHENHMMNPAGVCPANRGCLIPLFKVKTEEDFVNKVNANGEATEPGLRDALDRAGRYLEAGADLLFIETPQSVGQMRLIGERGRTADFAGELFDPGKTNTLPGAQALSADSNQYQEDTSR